MDPAYVSAFSALAGSVIGGLTTSLTTWINQRTQARADRRAHDLSRRQDLVRDFIVTAAKSYGDAYTSHGEPKIAELVDLYAMVSRMRVLAMPGSVAHADKLIHKIIAIYGEPQGTLAELNDLLKRDPSAVDPLGEFSEVARQELSRFSEY